MKNKRKILLLGISIVIAGYFFVKIILAVWGSLDALGGIDLERGYNTKSSEFLLHELHSLNWFREKLAYGILVDRKDKRVLPYILKKININKANAVSYVQSLAEIGDKDTLPVVVNIVNEQKDKTPRNELYWYSLVALSEFHYDPVWPVACKLADSDNVNDVILGVAMLGAFQKTDGLPLLENIKKRIAAKGYKPVYEGVGSDGRMGELRIATTQVNDAIKKIQDANAVSAK